MTSEFKVTGEALWTRMERAVERVNERLRRTVAILEESGVPYAVVTSADEARAFIINHLD